MRPPRSGQDCWAPTQTRIPMQRFLPPSRSPRWRRMATGRVCGRSHLTLSSALADGKHGDAAVLVFKRGDTKRLAKAVINRFGSFAGVLTAPDLELLATPGCGKHAVSAIRCPRGGAASPQGRGD